MVLIEGRIERLAGHTGKLATKCQELDRRLVRTGTKFEMTEKTSSGLRCRAIKKRDL